MGDMADYTLECMQNYHNYGLEPLYDNGGYKECRCCGVGELHWGQSDNGKWVLLDDDSRLHNCQVNPLKVEEYT